MTPQRRQAGQLYFAQQLRQRKSLARAVGSKVATVEAVTHSRKDFPLKLRLITAAAALLALAGAANAEEHIVQLLTKGDKSSMVFQPNFMKAAPGDTVKFVPGDKTHNVETIQGMIPDGAQEFKGKVGETITVTLTQEGVYGVKCNPHYGLGMVALIVVGKPVNLDAAQAVKQVGKARTVFTELFSQVTKTN